jgi:dienelactone hydrolase
MELLASVLLSLVCTAAAAREVPAGRVNSALALIDLLKRGEWEKATANFDATMKKALPPDRMKEIWESITKKVGPLNTVGASRTEHVSKYDVVVTACDFGKTKLDIRVVFDADGKVTGFSVRPAKGDNKYPPPAYAKPDSFAEQKLTLGKGDTALPGVLTLPKGDGPFPAVVLVHGSGPHDPDETVGPNKPFRDLAWGLASKGVAVLRYEKRTHAHPTLAADKITVKEEVIDDALDAARLLHKTPKIDPKRVYVLGHSLGALMAPRIAEQEPKLAGIVLWACPSRPLEDLILEQIHYIYSLEGKLSDEHRKDLEKLREQVRRVKDPRLKPDTPAEELPLGIAAPYWLALREYDQKATAAKLKLPVLILQGERDYQVTMTDFAGWKKTLAGKKNATLKSYPGLSHLFIKGEGKGTPKDYDKEGHVEEVVIDDVAKWVKGR